jgi:thiol-disulfide isomerase/thioredoxin
MTVPEPTAAEVPDADLQSVLDEELGRLPGHYRGVVVLCDLEGLTRREAASQLGLPEGSVASRLARARLMLAKRLTRRGVALSGGSVAAALAAGPASASVLPALVASTMKAASLLAAGQATGVSAQVAALTDGMVKAMLVTKIKGVLALALLAGIALAGAAGLLYQGRAEGHPKAVASPAEQEGQQKDEVKRAVTGAARSAEDAGGRRAARIALAAHADAAKLGKLPRFDYQVRVRNGPTALAGKVTPKRLRNALTAPVGRGKWVGWYEIGFAWDQDRVVYETRPGEANGANTFTFGTRADGWWRSEDKAKTSRQFVRVAGVSRFWDNPDHPIGTQMNLFEVGYLRLTPHRFWWGAPVKRTSHAMLTVPLEELSWSHLGSEEFASEACAVVESTWGVKREKAQRLWVGRKSGRVRGALTYLADSVLNELARFDDYREVAPGVWLPFREARTFFDGDTLRRIELVVTAARTNTDLSGRYAGLLPKEGDRVQDQRFAAAVNLVYSSKRSDDEVRKLADAEYKKQLQDREEFKRIVKPLGALVGKTAPALPADGWVGGKRPEVVGKPYLVHFWATWCGPCKADMPRLKALAASGITVVGMHPPGTAAAEVEKVVRDRKLGYPTFLAAGKWDGKSRTIGGYPAAVFPYCVLVDARGKVAAHGPLWEVTGRLRAEAWLAELAGRPAPALDAGAWFNSPPGGHTLAGLKGKVVLLDFWGKWCDPCVKNLPGLEELHRKYKGRGLVVVGVHSADRSDRLDWFLKKKKVSFPVLIDSGKSAERYQVDAWPTYFLIDRAGKVVWGVAHELPTAERIEQLLGN